MTNAQGQSALRARRKSQGLVRVEVWVPKQYREKVGDWVALGVKLWDQPHYKEDLDK